jgi:BlaI family transcriptional regulator, penicillinase repressor
MPRPSTPQPTEAELTILQVLWRRGPSSVREVWEALGETGSYTTVLKFLQIMLGKGLVRRDDSTHAHVYEAVSAEEATQQRLVRQMMDDVFAGSASQLVLRALAAKPVSEDERQAIRAILDAAGKGKR